MATSAAQAPLSYTSASPATVNAELLAVPWFDGAGPDELSGLDAATGGEIARAIGTGEFTGKPYELFLAPIVDGSWKARRLALIGAGPSAEYSASVARRVATAAGLAARSRRVARTALLVRAGSDPPAPAGDLVQAAAEGLTLSEFDSGAYKTSDVLPEAAVWTLVGANGGDALADRASRGRILGACSNLARQLANEPGNRLTPTEFARRAALIAQGPHLSIDVLDPDRIAELGMGLLLGVARGSSEPPRVIVIRYEPADAPAQPVLGLVGKGITFDTGGISIKPAEAMDRMKDDMTGGAAVVCAMRAIAALGPRLRVVGVVPTAENMPGGRAIKPGDILTSASGKTVEVINTDAEGRLILGDALWYAGKLGATHLVDVATLTGACVVALGKITSGLFGTPQPWVDVIHRIADGAGDRVWPMPLFAEYRDQLKSEIADLSNTGGRPAGAVTAAMFLKEFSGGLPWAHLDIAGTAWCEEARPYQIKGASGVAVRTLAELACAVDRWAATGA
jgi:leucyl aminopeptidase